MSSNIRLINSVIKNRYLLLVFRVVLGAVFIYASIHKILDPGAFAESIRNYLLLPALVTNLVAIILPWVEVVCGLFLVVGIFPRSCAAVVSALLAIFSAALIISLARGLDIDCGCFDSGQGNETIGILYVLRDWTLLFMSVSVMVYDRGFLSLRRE